MAMNGESGERAEGEGKNQQFADDSHGLMYVLAAKVKIKMNGKNRIV